MNLQKRLFELKDDKYREFHKKLIPNVDEKRLVGIRTPQMRMLAKEMAKEPDVDAFLNSLPHDYYEENNIHGFIIEKEKDFDKCIEQIERFLPYIDNWATCDQLRPKVFGKNKDKLLPYIEKWIQSGETYTIRFGIEMLMTFYLDDDFKPEYLDYVSPIRSEEYYVNMMIAWFFATALAKQWDAMIPYIEQRKLDEWTHKKAIQKARESFRITAEQKAYLNTLK